MKEKEIDAIKLLELYKACNFRGSGRHNAEVRKRIDDAILEIHHLVREKDQYKQMSELKNKISEKYKDFKKKKEQKEEKVTYIPKDLEDCFEELNRMLVYEEIELMKNSTEESMCSLHHGLGRHLRNTWELWRESRFARWFNDQGIKHADDMSGIILTSFWRHLNSKPIELDEQIKHYQEYWENMKKNREGQDESLDS